MKSPFNFRIQYENGSIIDMYQKDWWVESFQILSSSSDYKTGKIEGRDGLIPYGSTRNTRKINIAIQIEGANASHFDLIRDEVFSVFRSGEELRIRRDLQQGKELVCFVENEIEIDYQTLEDGWFAVELIMFEPFIRSIGTTADIHRDGINANKSIWGFGMGLIAVDESLIYKHNAVAGKKFRIFNAGNAPVHHPFQQKLKITISNVVGSTEQFQITNATNLSKARINIPLSSSDVVIYDGPNVSRNGLEFLRNTRKDFIELSQGWNTIEIYYCQSATIEFDFPFYYL
ncbi:phage tail domain-containing protein [Bacillus cereus]|uniref:phage tail domain-containing protein n=1 Tax=Bacillus cereus TaxID=1396 RepID=UPI00027ABBE9|nr:phage tail domain-containing protein [Bacillus cereus]EJS72897.1 hypothetical protein ICY_04108 [Bacillus cereus BAG2X1-3]